MPCRTCNGTDSTRLAPLLAQGSHLIDRRYMILKIAGVVPIGGQLRSSSNGRRQAGCAGAKRRQAAPGVIAARTRLPAARVFWLRRPKENTTTWTSSHLATHPPQPHSLIRIPFGATSGGKTSGDAGFRAENVRQPSTRAGPATHQGVAATATTHPRGHPPAPTRQPPHPPPRRVRLHRRPDHRQREHPADTAAPGAAQGLEEPTEGLQATAPHHKTTKTDSSHRK